MGAPEIGTSSAVWLRRFPGRKAADRRLICFPHAGSSIVPYHPWSMAAPEDIAVWAVQYPGRSARQNDPMPADVPSMASEIAQAIAETEQYGESVAFFGHSFGSAIAYEVARQLAQARTCDLAHLFVSGAQAPVRPQRKLWADVDDPTLIAQLRSLDGSDARVLDDPALRAAFIPLIRGDLRLFEAYRPAGNTMLDCPITAFWGDKDPLVSPADMQSWAELTSRPLTTHVFPGGHFYTTEWAKELLQLIGTTWSPPGT
jgi:pyochelin biosynthesis protein PchC